MYNTPGNADGSGINVQITPNYYTNNSFKLLYKNYVGNYAQSFNGYYVGVTAQTGLVRESYYSSLGPFFPQTFVVNAYRYNRFCLIFGRQWTMYNEGVVDVNLGVGFNKMNENAESEYTAMPPFHVHKNAAFFTSEIAFGIGKKTVDQSLPRKPKLRDSLILDHALLLDVNAILNSGIELSLLHGNHKKHLWQSFVRVRNLKVQGLNITDADSFNSIMGGLRFRHYPYATRYRNGVYVAGGYAYEHSIAYFERTRVTQDGDEKFVKSVLYDPHHFDVTIGFTTILNHKLVVEAYVANILTLSKGRGKVDFPRINDATGFRTELGVKMGVARFRRK